LQELEAHVFALPNTADGAKFEVRTNAFARLSNLALSRSTLLFGNASSSFPAILSFGRHTVNTPFNHQYLAYSKSCVRTPLLNVSADNTLASMQQYTPYVEVMRLLRMQIARSVVSLLMASVWTVLTGL
jgi:hypothetical protein